MTRAHVIIYHIIIPLIISNFLYVFFRPNSLIPFNISDCINDRFQTIRNLSLLYRESIPNWIIYSLPDFLWAYTFTTAIILINQEKFQSLNWYSFLLLTLVLLHEILQLFGLVRGHFDIIDLFSEASAFFISLFLFKYLEQKHTISKPPLVTEDAQ